MAYQGFATGDCD